MDDICTNALKEHGDIKKSLKLIVLSNCANRFHGFVIRSLELDNSFSRIAIRFLELAFRSLESNLFPRIRQSVLLNCDSLPRIEQLVLSDSNSFPRIRQCFLSNCNSFPRIGHLNSRERII